ncbi:hypothetical protein [Streptomyces sp. NPDC088812]|uniref:hypothetical protein n=1 Tax=Streptomyces sp. NPDC088812 TaxID=3365905 RepID=UPI0038079A89
MALPGDHGRHDDLGATVPEGAEAVLRLPDAAEEAVGAGRHERRVAAERLGSA